MDPTKESLPMNESGFARLVRGDSIWSPELGLGRVVSQYPDHQIIAQFGTRRMRLRYDEHILYRPHVAKQPRQRVKVQTLDGTISMTQFKKQQRDRIANEFILISEVARMLSMSKDRARALIEQKGIVITTQGRKSYIPITALQQLM